ncbi:MAG: hypothetical protein ACJBCI_07710, partial [Candidatus Tisiphia sp.]
ELNVYVNKIATLGRESLIRQLSKTIDSGSSLNYLTKEEVNDSLEDIETLNNMNGLSRSLVKIYDFAANNITKLTDKYLPKSEYYHYREPSKSVVRVEEVLDRVYEEKAGMDAEINVREEKQVVGLVGGNANVHNNSRINIGDKLGNVDNLIKKMSVVDDVTSCSNHIESNSGINDTGMLEGVKDGNIVAMRRKVSSKDRFYANIDYKAEQVRRSEENRERYRSEVDNLRREIAIRAESLAIDLLGYPNSKLSNKSTLKYGNKGSLAVKISGNKVGTWYDFESGKGGDIFDLVEKEKNYDFKEAVGYLQDRLGITPYKIRPNLQAVNDNVISDKYVEHCKQVSKKKSEELGKIRKAENLYCRSKEIELGSTAGQYLVETRNIDIDFAKEKLSKDIRRTVFYEKSTKQELEVLVAFARDGNGRI